MFSGLLTCGVVGFVGFCFWFVFFSKSGASSPARPHGDSYGQGSGYFGDMNGTATDIMVGSNGQYVYRGGISVDATVKIRPMKM